MHQLSHSKQSSLGVQHASVKTRAEARIMSEQKRSPKSSQSPANGHWHQDQTPPKFDSVYSQIAPHLSSDDLASEPCSLIHPTAPAPPVPPREIPDTEDVTLTPGLIVEKYKKVLPLKLVVSIGVYGADRSDTFCEGDVITAQFMRQLSYVLVEEKSGNHFQIPVASRLHFGLVYNPLKKLDQALKGYVFRSVGEILTLKPMPKLILAQKGWRGKAPSQTVEENDVLWVKGEHHDPMVPKVKFLKCIQANTGLVKLLRSDVQVPLSTKPSLLLLPLAEIIKHSPPPFHGVVESPKIPDRSLPAGLKDLSTVFVHEFSSNLSIIATRHDVPGTFELPALLDMDLHLAEVTEKQKDQMRVQSASLFASFSPALVDQCLVAYTLSKKLQNNIFTQRLLLNLVDQDLLKKTQKLIPPPTIQCFLPNPVPKGASNDTSTGSENVSSSEEKRLQMVERATQALLSDVKIIKQQFLSLNTAPLLEMGQELEGVKKLANTAFDQIPGVFRELNLLVERLKNLEQSRLSVTETLLQLQHTQAQQQEQLQFLQQQLENMLQQQVGERQESGTESEKISYQNVTLMKPSDGVCDPKKNTDYLETLNVFQVAQILHYLKMPEYIEHFMKEDITGMILVQCTDKILENDLHVKSALHRMKLMQLITGSLSVCDILQDEHFNT